MVSTRSSLKRSRGDASPPSGPSKKARMGAPKVPSKSLMDLPAEIRRLILTELLSCHEPVEFNGHPGYKSKPNTRAQYLIQACTPANGKLHPRILRTCKQLYLEGSEILYNNTINCRVGEPYLNTDQDPQFEAFVLGSPLTRRTGNNGIRNSLPPAVVHKISKVHVQLFAHQQRDKRDISQCDMESGIEVLAYAFRSAPAWKHVTIEMIHVYKSGKFQREPRAPADSARFESKLHPWRYIRNRTSVTITGVSGNLVDALPAAMTSTAPVADLQLAIDSLREYMTKISSSSFCHPTIPSQNPMNPVYRTYSVCARAVRRGDAKLFLRGRKRVMSLLNAIVMRHESQVFENDPAAWETGPDLSVPASDDVSNDALEEEQAFDEGDSFADEDESDEDPDTDAYEESDDLLDSDDDMDLDSDDFDYDIGGLQPCQCPQCRSPGSDF